MQLKPNYPSAEQAEKNRSVSQKKIADTRKLRRQLFIETQPTDLYLSFDDYTRFISGYSYESIHRTQQKKAYEQLTKERDTICENLQEDYRHLKYMMDSHQMSDVRKIRLLKFQLHNTIEKWQSLCYSCNKAKANVFTVADSESLY